MIRLENVCKSYDGGASFAVREVSLRIERGELMVILGESGSGKTTALKMINRLIDITSGDIFVRDQNVRQVNPVTLRRGIGYVFQRIGLFPHMTVGANVAVVPRLLGWSDDETAKRVDELLGLMGLSPATYRARLPRQLSGGQQQRIGFARALAAKPGVMLMDEPFGALDPLTRVELQNEYRRIHNDLGLTTVMVTHDIMEALMLADRIAVMRQGRVLQVGTPHELLTDPRHEYVSDMMATPRTQADHLRELTVG